MFYNSVFVNCILVVAARLLGFTVTDAAWVRNVIADNENFLPDLLLMTGNQGTNKYLRIKLSNFLY